MTVTIVCEAGLNHVGRLDTAKRLADAARNAQADVVKFQTYDPDKLMRKSDPDFKMLSSLALSRPDFIQLARHCQLIGIEFMTTPGEVDSLKFAVEELGVRRIKLGSDDLTNIHLQIAAKATGLVKIQSTGMGTLQEISDAMAVLGKAKTILLHCVSCYPCRIDQTNLRAIQTMEVCFGVPVGYSDHTASQSVCQAAVALGATLIEAHMMLMEQGPAPVDSAVSFTPMHFSTLVKGIRLTELMLGTGVKKPNADELKLIPKVRKAPDGFRGFE